MPGPEEIVAGAALRHGTAPVVPSARPPERRAMRNEMDDNKTKAERHRIPTGYRIVRAVDSYGDTYFKVQRKTIFGFWWPAFSQGFASVALYANTLEEAIESAIVHSGLRCRECVVARSSQEIAAGAAMRRGASQAQPSPPKRGIIVAVVIIALLVLAALAMLCARS